MGLRRRLMMQSGGEKKYPYYPLVINTWTDSEMIDLYGNLFETMRIAPDTLSGRTKYFAFAISKSTTTYKFSNVGGTSLRYYENGVLKFSGDTPSSLTLSQEPVPKHFVLYNATNCSGSDRIARWIVESESNVDYNNAIVNIATSSILRQVHYPRSLQTLYWNGGFNGISGSATAKDVNSCLWIPDNTYNTPSDNNAIRGGTIKKYRFPKTYRFRNSLYWFNPNSPTDLYVHWGLEDTIPNITSGGNNLGNDCKLHIPDLGDAELNTQLKNAYIAKGWTTTKFKKGIFNDVEATEPEFPY